jgi:HSP20 family molecular chaperone IbpA
MTTNTAVLHTKEEKSPAVEQTSSLPAFVPRCDIYENNDGLVLLADMPGVDEKSIAIHLEAGVLTLTGRVAEEKYPEMELTYSEYRAGDYERSFAVSEEVDTDKIEATIKNGVLRVFLPKMEKAKPKKITVLAG